MNFSPINFLMKVAFRSAIIIVILVILASLLAPAAEIHIGVSPFLDDQQRRKVASALPAAILDPSRVSGGSHVVVWDAWRLLQVAEFNLLERNFDSTRVRVRDLGSSLAKLLAWLRQPAPAIDGIAAGAAAVRMPEWVHAASVVPASGLRSFVVLGSPLYRCPSEPAFDMSEDARYPSDGHLMLGLRESVFGIAEKSGRLRRSTVVWWIPSAALWANGGHEHAVARFWSLFVQGQGGILTAFGPDLGHVLARAVRADATPFLQAQPDPADDKPLMRSARPRSMPVWLELPAAPSPAPALVPEPPATPPAIRLSLASPAREEPSVAVDQVPAAAPAVLPVAPPPLLAPPPPPPAAPVPVLPLVPPTHFDTTKTGIGIAWSAPVDLDLYVRVHPGARELSYRQDRSAEGRLYRDERKANAGQRYEFIEFHHAGPVDLSRATVWVNYYSGRTADVAGQVVLFERGRVRIGSFRLAAVSGNRGAGDRLRVDNPCWTEIRIEALAESSAPLLARRPDSD